MIELGVVPPSWLMIVRACLTLSLPFTSYERTTRKRPMAERDLECVIIIPQLLHELIVDT